MNEFNTPAKKPSYEATVIHVLDDRTLIRCAEFGFDIRIDAGEWVTKFLITGDRITFDCNLDWFHNPRAVGVKRTVDIEDEDAPTDATLSDELPAYQSSVVLPESAGHGYKTVTIPSRDEHDGLYSRIVTLKWTCPVCGGKRGDPYDALSFDGSRRMNVHSWNNACGHDRFDPRHNACS